MNFFNSEIGKNAKSIKRELIIADIAIMVLGVLLTFFPSQANEIIFWAIGIILTLIGLIRIISYFAAPVHEIFGSFALVQGTAFIGFGVLVMVKPDFFKDLLAMCLGIVLIIGGIMKLQYAFDFMRMKAGFWLAELIGSIAIIVLGVLALIDPFGAADTLMMFIGISFLVNGVWDLISILYLSNKIKKVRNAVNNEFEKAELTEKAIDVEYKEEK